MANFQNYRQGFEGGTTLSTASPELIDLDSAFAIYSGRTHSFTGTQSLMLKVLGTNHTMISNVKDSLSGDVTVTAYLKNGGQGSYNLYARGDPAGVQPTSYQRLSFAAKTGLSIVQSVSDAPATLVAPISGVVLPTDVWLCLELRCRDTVISARVIRQDSGQFFVNTGSGSWSATPQTQSGTATLAKAAGGFGVRVGDSNSCYIDSLIYESAVPSIDIPSFNEPAKGSTQQLTAGGFTDPLYGVMWSSSNPNVATVNSDGLVTAVAAGTATITAIGKRDPSQTATAAAMVGPATAVQASAGWPHISAVRGFATGLVGLVGYTVFRGDGSGYAARSTAGVFNIGQPVTIGYAAQIMLPLSGSYIILWDDGAGKCEFEVVNRLGVEPPSKGYPDGLSQSQVLALILATVSGPQTQADGTYTFSAPDGVAPRIKGKIDADGNRTGVTLTPPV